MRAVGLFLISVGLLWALAASTMNVTVSSGAAAVNNIGLMEQRRNHLMFAGLTILVGVILFGFGSIQKQTSSDNGLKPCPFCAERIQPAALKCRYCNSELPEGFRVSAVRVSVGAIPEAPGLVEQNEIGRTLVATFVALLILAGGIAFAVYASKKSVAPAQLPVTPVDISPLTIPPLEYPAADDPRAKKVLRACIEGKPYALEHSKWVPNIVMVGDSPLGCVVQK